MTVPYIFANATGSLPLVELDINFANISNTIAAATGNIAFNDTTITTAAANSNIVLLTTSSNTGNRWTFGVTGQLSIPGAITSNRSIAIFANTAGAANVTLVANGALGNSTFIFDSTGNLVSPGNVIAVGNAIASAFVGSGQYIGNLLLNSTIGNIVANVSNNSNNISNLTSDLANTDANVFAVSVMVSNTNSNVSNTNSNVANLTVTVANNTANIANLQAASYSNVNAAAYLTVYGGNIFASNISATGNVDAGYVRTALDIYAQGSLYVNGTDTIIDTSQITSNVATLTLNHDVTVGNRADLDGSGLLLGQNGLVSWTYDSPTDSWQTATSIQPQVGTPVNLGNALNAWRNIYASNAVVNTVSAVSVTANVITAGNIRATDTANISTLIVVNNTVVGGDLYVNGNTTVINTTAIASDVPRLILDKDNTTGALSDGSGIQVGSSNIATLLYDYDTASWQSNLDITPAANVAVNLGNINNRWLNVVSLNVNTNNVTAGNITTANVFGDLLYGNTIYAADAVYTDTVSANVLTAASIVGNVATVATLSAVGNIATANFFIGNGHYITGLPAGYSNADVAAYLPTYSGNLDTVNIVTANTVTANVLTGNTVTANLFSGNGSQLTNIVAVTANTVVDNAQPNITSVGTLTALSVTGNVGVTDTVTANTVIADTVGAVAVAAESIVGNVVASVSITGNIISGVSIVGNIETAAQPNITSVGTLTSLSVAGAAVLNTASANSITVADLAAQVGGFVYANTTGALLNSNLVVLDTANATVVLTANAAMAAVTANTVSVLGNVTASYFIGNGSQLTGLPEQYGNANVADYLPTYSGNLDAVNSISATGNITGSYILGNGSQLTGLPEQYGNANVAAYLPTYSGNLDTVNTITATGNITGSYILGNGSQLTGMYSNTNVADYLPLYSGDLTVDNISATGNVYIDADTTIQGNLQVNGTTTTINSNIIVINDLYIQLANNQNTYSLINTAGLELGDFGNGTPLVEWRYYDSGNTWATNVGISATANIISGANISAVGNITASYFVGNGSQLSNVVANVNQLTNGSYATTLESTGVLEFPLVNDQQQALTGTTTTVYGDPYTVEADPDDTQIIWTATSNNVVGFKMSVRTQAGNAASGGITNVELADITCASDGSSANTSFVISNRVKSNIAAPDTTFSVATTNVGNLLIVSATNNDSQTEFYTHSVTEFNKT